MGGQLDGNFLPFSLPHKFIILIVTSFICLSSIIFFLSLITILSSPIGGGVTSPHPKLHLDRFIRFRTARGSAQQTQTTPHR